MGASYWADDSTDELEVPGTGGERVTMRATASWEDEVKVAQSLIPIQDPAERGRAYTVARTLIMIESWTLKTREGDPLTLDAEAFGPRGLNRTVANWLVNEAAIRYGDRPQESELPFDSRSKASPTGAAPTTQTLLNSSLTNTSGRDLAGSLVKSGVSGDGL